jgi:hypothetical protein
MLGRKGYPLVKMTLAYGLPVPKILGHLPFLSFYMDDILISARIEDGLTGNNGIENYW